MNREDFTNKTFTTKSFRETQRLGRDFAKILRKGDVACLYGDLGSGKTTFVQGLAQGLGIKNRIISPTFVIVRQYRVSFGYLGGGEATTSTPARCNIFYHIDLYRMEGERDIDGLGIEEILNNKNNIIVIEWAEKLGRKKPSERIDIEFLYEKDNVRKITFRSLNQ